MKSRQSVYQNMAHNFGKIEKRANLSPDQLKDSAIELLRLRGILQPDLNVKECIESLKK